LLKTVRWVPSNANVRALQAAQPRARNSAADEPASRHAFGQRIHTSIPNSLLAPRRRTRLLPISIHGRPLAEGRLGRTGAWGGREAGAEARPGRKEAWGGSEPGAEASLERKRAWGGRGAATVPLGRKGACQWGGREPRVEGRLGRKGGWGGREPRAEGSLGRTGVWGGREYGAEGGLPLCHWGGREHGAEGSLLRAEGSLGWKGGWGGREPGAEGSLGRKGA
jgi:hypothetical protein